MPVSKKRKKKGKKVEGGTRITVDPNKESHLTLQDLINVLAYQEYVKDGTIVPSDVKMRFDEPVPVTVGEGENKRQIGTASPIPGNPDGASIHIDDPEVLKMVQGPMGEYSIDKENQE